MKKEFNPEIVRTNSGIKNSDLISYRYLGFDGGFKDIMLFVLVDRMIHPKLTFPPASPTGPAVAETYCPAPLTS